MEAERKCWARIFERCYSPSNASYKNYGARGIGICERWHDFNNFYQDMGPKPDGYSIERKDSNKDYSPENCCWIPRKEQNKNRRKFKNNTSGRTGVYWLKNKQRWFAMLRYRGKTIGGPHRKDIADAIKDRELMEKEYGFKAY